MRLFRLTVEVEDSDLRDTRDVYSDLLSAVQGRPGVRGASYQLADRSGGGSISNQGVNGIGGPVIGGGGSSGSWGTYE